MEDLGKTGRERAAAAKLLLAVGCAFLGAAICMGIAGISGVFVSIAAQATGIMVALLGLSAVFIALGLSRLRTARLAGWKPAYETAVAHEQNPENRGALSSHEEEPLTIQEEDDNRTLETSAADHTELSPSMPTAAPAAAVQPTTSQQLQFPEEDSEDPVKQAVIPDEHEELLDKTAQEPLPSESEQVPMQPRTSDTGRANRMSKTFSSFAAKLNPEASESIPRQIARKRLATIERMLLRSENIFAAAKDLTASGRSVDAFADLSTMLATSDALKLTEPPHIKPIKLSRNNRYWLGSDVPEASDDVFDAVASIEAAFNICTDMIAYEGEHPAEAAKQDTFEKVRSVLAATSKMKPDYTTRSDALALAYPTWSDSQPLGEWELRMNVANAAENAGLPFRIAFDMKTNAQEKLVLVDMMVPRPTCFSIATDDKAQQEALARDYAFRSALFMAKAALGAPDPNRAADLVVVTCHTRARTETVLSLEATREDLPQLQGMTRHAAPICEFTHPNVRMSWEHDWLDPVYPHLESDDPLFSPERYSQHVELSQRPCDDLLAHATGARREEELGTIEGIAMKQAWGKLEGQLSAFAPTVENAVAAARKLQESEDDPDVHDACSRVMRALVDGTAEPGQTDQLESIFNGHDSLTDALLYGAKAFASRQAPELEQAVTKLTQALSPSLQIGLMDDTESVFRHFRSTAERVSYNLHCSDKRHVCMVPRAYYAANEMAAHMLCLLNRADEAEPFVNEIVRLAPLSASAVVTKARVLEDLSRLFEAIDLVNDAIPSAPTVHDAALCYYRMAYLQWRTGNHDVAAAAYRASISMRTDISPQAQSELDELLESDEELQDCSAEEAYATMEAGGVNIWPREERREEISKAAVLCADRQVYPAAKQLGMALLEFHHDDALIDVCRSFSA